MQIIKTTYKCDQCLKTLSEPHLSITFGKGYSGFVHDTGIKGNKGEVWVHSKECLRVVKDIEIAQFCNGKCLERWFK